MRRNVPFYVKQDTFVSTKHGTYFQDGDVVHKPYMIITDELFSLEEITEIFQDLSHLSNLTLHKSHHREKGKYGLNITHVNATKLHGINYILEATGIKKDEVIAAGDGYNDFPLLMAAGLKVAMGNAVDELKEIADHIAPSVDEDGIVDVINKFILQK
jgi:hydroxymethylpyrimidine pyrophosphatase-like HAD family hydrolase